MPATNLENSPEFQPALARIHEAYTSELHNFLSGLQHKRPFWTEMAEEFPTLRKPISGLATTLEYAASTREQLFYQTEQLRALYFGKGAGSYLMADILSYRVNQAASRGTKQPESREAHAMIQEYGDNEGLLGERNDWPLLIVIKGVLLNQIKTTPQNL